LQREDQPEDRQMTSLERAVEEELIAQARTRRRQGMVAAAALVCAFAAIIVLVLGKVFGF